MEIYDKAHELEAAIKECQEYKDFVAAGQELAKDEKTKHLAYAQSMGDKPIRKKIDHLNQMAEFIKNNQTAVEYLNHYNKWQSMAGEVFQIIQNAMAEGMSILDQ